MGPDEQGRFRAVIGTKTKAESSASTRSGRPGTRRYRGEDGKEHARHFGRKLDAARWLEAEGSPLPGRRIFPLPKPPVPPRPHVLYQFRDGDGVLLYVGVTAQDAMRWSSHRIWAARWPEVRHVDVEHCPDLPSAAAAGRAAIRTELQLQLHNIVHAS